MVHRIVWLATLSLALLLPAARVGAELSPYYSTLTVAQEGDRAELSWTNVRDMGGYRLLYDVTPPTEAFDGSFDFSHDNDWRTTLATRLPAGSSYHVAVQGYNAHTGAYTRPSNVEHFYVGEITQLEPVGLPPPANLRAEVSGNDVTLRWEPVTDALGYRLYLGEASGDYDWEAPFDVGNRTSVTARGRPAATTRYVAVTAYGVVDNPVAGPYPYPRCESRYSNEVVVVTENGDGRWQRESLVDGAMLTTDFSASTIHNGVDSSQLVISGTVPPELFPDGSRLNVDLQLKTPDHPREATRIYLADTFRVIVSGGQVYAEVDHDVPYPPLGYQLVVSFRAGSNHSTLAAAVADNMEEQFGVVYSDPMLVANKDISIGTVNEHLAFRQTVLGEMSAFLDDLELIYTALVDGLTLPSADNPDPATTIDTLVSQVSAWRNTARLWTMEYVTVQERSLIGELRTIDAWAFSALDAYEEGNDTLVSRELERMRAGLDRYRPKLERRIYVVDRVVHLRMPDPP